MKRVTGAVSEAVRAAMRPAAPLPMTAMESPPGTLLRGRGGVAMNQITRGKRAGIGARLDGEYFIALGGGDLANEATDVFAEDTDGDEEVTKEEGDCNHERSPARDGMLAEGVAQAEVGGEADAEQAE